VRQQGGIGFASLPHHAIPVDERHHLIPLRNEVIGGETLNLDSFIECLEEAHDFSMATAGLSPLTRETPFSIGIHPRGIFVDTGQDGGYIAMPKRFIKLLDHTYIPLLDRFQGTPPVADKSQPGSDCKQVALLVITLRQGEANIYPGEPGFMGGRPFISR
jgi:hypothetical protein